MCETDTPSGTVTITAIEPLPSNPNRRRIKVAGRRRVTLADHEVERLGLEVGMAWTEELARRVEASQTAMKIRKAAMARLARRSYSRGDLAERLLKKDFPSELVDQVLDQLAEDGWLDDELFARQLAESILRQKPAGRRLLVQKLVQKRVDRELAERTAREVLSETDPVEDATALVERRLQSMSGLSRATRIRRLSGLLARRGFDPDTVRSAINALRLQDDDSDAGDP
ncbi:MAG: RecX family transcriptional regulator [Phycisphaerales bacterium]|nr:MAG: RecX family transcriptional regulator [Phycisphaerales bacterium]